MAPILSNLYTKENTSPSLFDHSIDYSLGFEPAECSYIEISPDPNGTSTIREGFLYPDQVEEWLFPGLSVPGSPDGKHAQTAKEDTPMGQLRLLLSISETSNADKTVIMPWSQTTFEHICQKLSAPEHIVDILTHNTPHVAQLPVEHRVNGKDAVMSNGIRNFLSPNKNEVTESSLSVQSGHRRLWFLYNSFDVSYGYSNHLCYYLSTE